MAIDTNQPKERLRRIFRMYRLTSTMRRFLEELCVKYSKIEDHHIMEYWNALHNTPSEVLELVAEEVLAEGCSSMWRKPYRPVVECMIDLAKAASAVKPRLKAIGIITDLQEEPTTD